MAEGISGVSVKLPASLEHCFHLYEDAARHLFQHSGWRPCLLPIPAFQGDIYGNESGGEACGGRRGVPTTSLGEDARTNENGTPMRPWSREVNRKETEDRTKKITIYELKFDFSKIDAVLPDAEKMQEKDCMANVLENNHATICILSIKVEKLENKLSKALPRIDEQLLLCTEQAELPSAKKQERRLNVKERKTVGRWPTEWKASARG